MLKLIFRICYSIAIIVPLYLAFNIIAQEYNKDFIINEHMTEYVEIIQALFGGPPRNFYYWWAIAIWPTFSFLCGFTPLFLIRLWKHGLKIELTVAGLSMLIWYNVHYLDCFFKLSPTGLCGFKVYPMVFHNPIAITTPWLSTVLCPFFLLLGMAIAGLINVDKVLNFKQWFVNFFRRA